ncbi:MAG: CdaR family protein [Caldisericum sp.]|uniref:CdaR family protein n=1 Tax=Caldisericum TaxID=693074 RepID=UPI003C777366
MKFLSKIFNIKVIAVIFAIGLWYYVSVTQGPVISKTFKNVPVVPINVPSESYISNALQTVSVVAEGPSKVILGLKDSDFVATVNLLNKKEGEFLVDVEVTPPSSAIRIKSFTPDKIKVVLESISSKKFPVVSEFINATQTTQFFPSLPIVSPSSVVAFGPGSELSKIKRVYISIDVSKITGNTTVVLPVQVETIDGSNLQNVYLNPSSVVAEVKVSEENTIVTVPIVPTIQNSPPQGFGIKSISIQPSVITISGPISLVTNIKSVTTDPIDVSLLTSKTDFTVKLSKIDNVTFPVNTCKVTVDVSPIVSKTFTVQVKVVAPQGRQYSVSQESINVIIAGFKEVIDTITSDMIKCTVDATTLDIGTYTLPIIVSGLPQNVILQTITPTSVEVKIY